MQQQLQNSQVDLCISSPPLTGDGIEYITLFSEEIFLVVPYDHRFSQRKSISLIEAADEEFISLKEGFGIRDLTERLCLQAGFAPNIIFESQVAINIPDMVKSNLGVALLPMLGWEKNIERTSVWLHIDDIEASRITALSYLKDRYLSSSALKFKDFAIKKYENI
ncbi:HTH-type transcriptional regulator GltC [bioreactor metagenome]|uniref:HTH-type transcriptional regulator GltC n=1 Tax=bioreactor metagenome TaxID=1076179 RepID=A0A645EH23_9ZZZZ